MKVPDERIVARSMTFRSSRTLPGHAYCSSIRIACWSTAAIRFLIRVLNSLMNA